MRLRSSKASKIAALTETAANSDNGDPIEAKPSELPVDSESDKKYGAEAVKPQRKAPARRKIPAGPMRPDLVELVIREMGRKDLFPKDTLKALRMTSRGFKAFIDGNFPSLSTVTAQYDTGIEQLLRSPSTIQTMETFRYFGSLRQAPEMILGAAGLVAANPSQLKKLVLNHAGLVFDILVHLSLPNLTCLEINGLGETSKALERLRYKKKEDVWPLRELVLCSEHAVPHTVLVPALKTFNQLRKLTLCGWKLFESGPLDPEGFSEDSFPELETLELDVNDPGGLDLLSKARLPSLLHLRLGNAQYDNRVEQLITSVDAPWVQQLQSLTLKNKCRKNLFSGDASVLSAFHSGALTSLVIKGWEVHHELFESVHLPGLTSLKLELECNSISVRVTELATASLPLLSSLTILGRGRRLEADDINSLNAFLQLRSLSLFSKMDEGDWKWLIANIMPRLETFGASDEQFVRSISALDPSVDSWPLLRNLDLYCFALVAILPIAPYFPSITELGLYNVYRPNPMLGRGVACQQSSYEAIINAAINERAWLDLKYLSFGEWGWTHLKNPDVAVLKRAWPKVSMYGGS